MRLPEVNIKLGYYDVLMVNFTVERYKGIKQ